MTKGNTRSKRAMESLPQFDNEPVSVDSDDDLPTIDDCLKPKGLSIKAFWQLILAKRSVD